jgi:hypothetical protein
MNKPKVWLKDDFFYRLFLAYNAFCIKAMNLKASELNAFNEGKP